MSITADIRERLAGILESIVPSIGVVHRYERHAADWKKFLDLYRDPASQKIRGWTISHEGAPGRRNAPDESLRQPIYIVRGYYGLEDAEASEITFDTAVEAVCDAIGAYPSLSGLTDHVSEPTVRAFEPRMYGTVLCHYAEIAVPLHITHIYTLVTA